MFGPNTYLIWLACFIGFPLGILLVRHGRTIRLRVRGLAWVIAGSLVGGWAWDALAVRVGLWFYDPGHLAGWWALGLPLEEWLWIAGVTLLFGSVTVILAERAGLGRDDSSQAEA